MSTHPRGSIRVSLKWPARQAGEDGRGRVERHPDVRCHRFPTALAYFSFITLGAARPPVDDVAEVQDDEILQLSPVAFLEQIHHALNDGVVAHVGREPPVLLRVTSTFAINERTTCE